MRQSSRVLPVKSIREHSIIVTALCYCFSTVSRCSPRYHSQEIMAVTASRRAVFFRQRTGRFKCQHMGCTARHRELLCTKKIEGQFGCQVDRIATTRASRVTACPRASGPVLATLYDIRSISRFGPVRTVPWRRGRVCVYRRPKSAAERWTGTNATQTKNITSVANQ